MCATNQYQHHNLRIKCTLQQYSHSRAPSHCRHRLPLACSWRPAVLASLKLTKLLSKLCMLRASCETIPSRVRCTVVSVLFGCTIAPTAISWAAFMLLRAISVRSLPMPGYGMSLKIGFQVFFLSTREMAHAVEAAAKYSYDSVADQWHRETVWVRIDDEPFAMVTDA